VAEYLVEREEEKKKQCYRKSHLINFYRQIRVQSNCVPDHEVIFTFFPQEHIQPKYAETPEQKEKDSIKR